jgi:tRNA A37 threonylcarbamoyladenosine biosynthesis protein TsaE
LENVGTGPLIGRAQELFQLQQAAAGLAMANERSMTQVVVLSGDAGIGKTRLAQELVWRLFFWLFVVCWCFTLVVVVVLVG